jgi:hypothetical protein
MISDLAERGGAQSRATYTLACLGLRFVEGVYCIWFVFEYGGFSQQGFGSAGWSNIRYRGSQGESGINVESLSSIEGVGLHSSGMAGRILVYQKDLF